MNIIELAKEAGFDTDLPGFKDGTAIALKLAALVRAETIKAYQKGELDFQEAGRATCELIERAEREWVDLTDDEIINVISAQPHAATYAEIGQAVIAAFKEKNK